MSAAPVLRSTIAFKIEVVNGPHKGQSFTFDKTVVTLGRGSENDIVLADDPKISRNHAEIRFQNGEFSVQNLSQKNFLVVRGKKVQSEVLELGDKIYIGDSEIVFSLDQPNHAPQRTIVAMVKPGPPSIKGPQPNTATRVVPSGAPPTQHPQMNYVPPPTATASPSVLTKSGGIPPRLKFYGIIAIVGAALYLFFSSGSKKKVEVFQFGPSENIQRELLQADEKKKMLLEQRAKENTQQSRRAQENFIKGFRDFRQGQYGRAKEAFQVVLTLDSQNEEARRYLTLSKLKFDEQVKDFVNKGRANFENKNYRLCKSDFLTVMTMLNQNTGDPSYVDAKKLYDLCDLAQGGR